MANRQTICTVDNRRFSISMLSGGLMAETRIYSVDLERARADATDKKKMSNFCLCRDGAGLSHVVAQHHGYLSKTNFVLKERAIGSTLITFANRIVFKDATFPFSFRHTSPSQMWTDMCVRSTTAKKASSFFITFASCHIFHSS